MNLKPETIKPLEENIGGTLFDISLANDFFLEFVTKSRGNKQLGLKNLKCFCTANETINKMKKQPIKWEKYLQILYLIRG